LRNPLSVGGGCGKAGPGIKPFRKLALARLSADTTNCPPDDMKN
jgi:hypothetical protein